MTKEAGKPSNASSNGTNNGTNNGMTRHIGTDSYETLQAIKSNARFWKWAIPIAITVALVIGGYLGKTVLLHEINTALEKALAPLRIDIQRIDKKVDRLEVQAGYQAEQIREFKLRGK
jgi:hypothetical protein